MHRSCICMLARPRQVAAARCTGGSRRAGFLPARSLPLPVARCGVVGWWPGGRVAGRAAAHHEGASVVTIIRASCCRATERLYCTLRPCLKAPTAAGRAPERREAVHRSKNRLHHSLLGPVEAARGVEHHWGEVHTHPAIGVSAVRPLLLPLVLQEGRSTASHAPAGGGVRVDYGQIHHGSKHEEGSRFLGQSRCIN